MHMDDIPIHSIKVNKIAAASFVTGARDLFGMLAGIIASNVGKCGCDVY
jgi:hypothetical protein